MWKLKLKVGEQDGALLDYTDERGRTFKVKLVGIVGSDERRCDQTDALTSRRELV